MTRSKESCLRADIVIIGGGTGGVAAALAAARNGCNVILTESTDWLGGQFTSQAVPPDEHPWIEDFGCTGSYRKFRNCLREFHRSNYPLTPECLNSACFNPGNASVSRLAFSPHIGHLVLQRMLAPYIASGNLRILLNYTVTQAETQNDRIQSVRVSHLRTGEHKDLHSHYFLDATELGDLLPLSGTEYVKGAESRLETGEAHAPIDAQPDNMQAMTWCFAVQYCAGQDHTIEKPENYTFWKNYVPPTSPPWPGKLLDWTYSHPIGLRPFSLPFDPPNAAHGPIKSITDLWTYRRVLDHRNFQEGFAGGDVSIVNWPQNDYMLGHLIDVSESEKQTHLRNARQLSLSLLHWMQTEAPRHDGRTGWPELRLRGDLTGTGDGLAKYPYIRESRRIRAKFTVREQHIVPESGANNSPGNTDQLHPVKFHDSVGVGYYRIDLHPSTGGDNYIDLPALPFEIPLGSLIPQRVRNLLPSAKNAGVTHITNGCFRLHPVEWNIGESASNLACYCIRDKCEPAEVLENPVKLAGFQQLLTDNDIEIHWPPGKF